MAVINKIIEVGFDMNSVGEGEFKVFSGNAGEWQYLNIVMSDECDSRKETHFIGKEGNELEEVVRDLMSQMTDAFEDVEEFEAGWPQAREEFELALKEVLAQTDDIELVVAFAYGIEADFAVGLMLMCTA